MKKLSLLLLFSVMFLVLRAQPHISISGGVKMVDSQPSTTTLLYVDESPSRDNIYKDIDPIGDIAINLNVRLQDDTEGMAFRLFGEAQGYVGSINGLALSAGYLYSGTGEGKVKIQPELGAVLGYCSKGVGTIQNNDVYIQVNDTRFQDYTNVNVALRNAYVGVKPGLSFVFSTGENSQIGLGVNYQLSYKAGFISFRGLDDNGNEAYELEYLTARNVRFYANGSRTDKNPYNPDGLEFKIFYSF